jgi:hypothetical protein
MRNKSKVVALNVLEIIKEQLKACANYESVHAGVSFREEFGHIEILILPVEESGDYRYIFDAITNNNINMESAIELITVLMLEYLDPKFKNVKLIDGFNRPLEGDKELPDTVKVVFYK